MKIVALFEVEDEDFASRESEIARKPGAEECDVLAFEHVESFVLRQSFAETAEIGGLGLGSTVHDDGNAAIFGVA